MLLKQFPDIHYVRQLKNGAAAGTSEWRNVVLNVNCQEANRTQLESPYSFFLNKRGHSYCTVQKQQYRVETDTFLFTQPGDVYDLNIDNLHKTETCNIHINKHFFDSAVRAATNSHSHLLDDPHQETQPEACFITQLYPRTDTLSQSANKLLLPETYTENKFEEILVELIDFMLVSNTNVKDAMSKLLFVKPSVRFDIYKRLSVAKDYMHSNYSKQIELDDIAREIGMSKFHFLRVFKTLYHCTPHQYLTKIRINKATDRLRLTRESIANISSGVGYEYPNSFIKAFNKVHHIAPLQYRKQFLAT